MVGDQPPDRFKLLETWLLLCIGAIVPAFLLFNYLGYNYLTSLSFNTSDGNCDTSIEAVGIHCFGDYSYFLSFDGGREDNLSNSLYPAVGRLVFQAFAILIEVTLTHSKYIKIIITFS